MVTITCAASEQCLRRLRLILLNGLFRLRLILVHLRLILIHLRLIWIHLRL